MDSYQLKHTHRDIFYPFITKKYPQIRDQQTISFYFFQIVFDISSQKMIDEINLETPEDREQYQCQCQCNSNSGLHNREILPKQRRNIVNLPEEILQYKYCKCCNGEILPKKWRNILSLPVEILEYIFSFLGRDSLMDAVLVCRFWNEVWKFYSTRKLD